MTHHSRQVDFFRRPVHKYDHMTKMAIRQNQPHIVHPSLTDRLIMWIAVTISRTHPWNWLPETILTIHFVDFIGCMCMWFVLFMNWIGPKGLTHPLPQEVSVIIQAFALVRFLARILVKARCLQDPSDFRENAAVEFSTKVGDAMTIAEVVFFVSGFLRMHPKTALYLLISLLNYHQIRTWRSHFRKSQGPALWVGGLTWEFLSLCVIFFLSFVIPFDWTDDIPIWQAQIFVSKYSWLTSASGNIALIVSFLIFLFQITTTGVDLGRMIFAIETEPGMRRQGTHRTVFRLLLAALIPNMVFNNLTMMWASGIAVSMFCFTPVFMRSSSAFLVIIFGNTSTLLQITYDRITFGSYGLIHMAEVILVIVFSVECFLCYNTEMITVAVIFFLFVYVWMQGIRKLSSRETIL